MTPAFDDVLLLRAGRAGTVSVWFREIGTCRSDIGCGRVVYWCLTANQKWMPVDPVAGADGYYIPHWGTCPRRKAFTRKKAEQGGER